MATRLIGTDSTNPRLPDDVAVTATQTEITDTAGLFVSTTVENALAEVVAALQAANLWWNPGSGGGGGGGGSGTSYTQTDLVASANPTMFGDSASFQATVTLSGVPTFVLIDSSIAGDEADFGTSVTFTAGVIQP